MGLIAGIVSGGAKVLGGIFGNDSAKESAAAQERAAAIQLQAAKINKGIYYNQAKTAQANANHALWMGKYTAARLRSQAAINAQLSTLEHTENLRAADIVEQSSQRALQFAGAQATQFRREAQDTLDTGAERGTRMFREALQATGRGRVDVARAGFVDSGSELDKLVENASRMELSILDNAKQAAGEARRLEFAGDVAQYEGEVAAFEGGEDARRMRFGAEISKFMADVDGWNTEQDAIVTLVDAKRTSKNYKSQAKDLRRQGDLALMYGMADYEATMAGASATRTEGRMGLLSSIAGGVDSVSAWRGRYN
jgi:hypothetical protein